MKLMTEVDLLTVLTFLLGSLVVFAPVTEAQTIHALLIIDDANPVNAALHQANKDMMERLFRHIKNEAGIPFELSELKTNVDDSSAEWMSEENVRKWTQTVNADRDDVVFVYFSGHGGTHDETRELYLEFPGRVKVDRKGLADAVDTIPCRLKIFLTDTGSHGVPITINIFYMVKTAYANLFLEHAGFLNVAGAVEGEYALGNAEGGIFTRAFVDAMLLPPDTSDDDEFVSWKDIFEATKKETHTYFQVFWHSPNMPESLKAMLTEVGQQSQRPKYFGELPKRFRRQ